MKKLLIPALLIISLSCCKVIKPLPPDLPPSQINSTPLPDSKIDVPVIFDLTPVFADFNSKIPAGYSGQGPAGPGQYRWSIQRDPFGFGLAGNSLNVTDNAHCSGGGYIKNPFNGQWNRVCSCDVNVAIALNATFNLLNDYSLSGNVNLTQFDLSPCNLTFASINVTPILKPVAVNAINNALVGLNQKINQYNIRAIVQNPWSALFQPVKIADIGYLLINPSQIRSETPTGSQNTLNFPIGITAKPIFSLTDPGPVQSTPIPDISNAAGNGFAVNMDAHLQYKPLSDDINKTIDNTKIAVGKNGYIIIKDAEISGMGNNHLLINIKFSGKQGWVCYHGNLYFTCIPDYDINSGNLYISDIDFDANTSAKLTEKAAAWILNSTIKTFLNSQVHFNVANQINVLKDKMNQSINRQIGANVNLSGNVTNLSLQGILPQSDYLLMRVATSGNLAVKIN